MMYKDSLGIETIGIGHNLRDKPISDKVIDLLFEEDLKEVEVLLDKNLPWWAEQDEVRQAALIDLCFNMGIGSLMGFRNTLAAWKAGDYSGASVGLQNSKWYTQVGNRGPRIVKMVETGEWPWQKSP